MLFNYVDRLALGVLLQDIKLEFNLSDTQLGLLSGIAFALFYFVGGIPIARWADRGNRVAIISLTALLWSIAVAACGLAISFLQLLLIRVLVAVGEAGAIPPANSLMADYFARGERPRAAALYGLAGTFCAVPGYWLAGWFNELYGWRITFMLLASPGVVLAALAWFTLKEPRRSPSSIVLGEAATAVAGRPQPSLMLVGSTLARNVTFRHLLMCQAVSSFFMYGLGQWHAPYLIRSFGLDTAQIGLWLTVAWGAGALVGAYLGGNWMSRYAPNNERLQMSVMAIGFAISGVLTVFVYLAPNAYTVFVLMALASIGLTIPNGPLIATLQTLVPHDMRAMSIAIVFFFANLIGAGLGPLAAGVLSDAYHGWAGEESLRYALFTLAPGYFWAAWHAWRAGRTVMNDLRGTSYAVE